MSNQQTPLIGPENYHAALQLKEYVQRGLASCDQAEHCQMNVAGQRQTFIMLGEFADNVLRTFFPSGKPN